MKLAFCLFKYFPFGGLQRDFLRIAQACYQRGHQIDVFTLEWQGEIPAAFRVTLIPVRGFSNHRRCMNFAKALADYVTKDHYDAIIGFNRLPNLDIYFAADVCYQALIREQRSWFYRLLPRYRCYAALEQAVFDKTATTQILLLAASEQKQFCHYYGTAPERFHLLPPGVAADRQAPADVSTIRAAIRRELNLSPEHQLVLLIGSNYKLKGVDRALYAMASLIPEQLNNTCLIVIGESNPAPFMALAKRLAIGHAIRFLGARFDVPRFLWSADLLLHPAYHEAAGMVLIEALVAGLPVLTTENCGYAFHIEQAGAGQLLKMPFQQTELNRQLVMMLNSAERSLWCKNALEYAAKVNLSQLEAKAVAFIEHYAQVVSPTTSHI